MCIALTIDACKSKVRKIKTRFALALHHLFPASCAVCSFVGQSSSHLVLDQSIPSVSDPAGKDGRDFPYGGLAFLCLILGYAVGPWLYFKVFADMCLPVGASNLLHFRLIRLGSCYSLGFRFRGDLGG